jgi:gas vesicle protein
MGENASGGEFFAGFLIGALVGAAVTFLFAPQSGEETRMLIRDKGIELKDRADGLSGEARVRVKEAVGEGKTAAAKKKEELLSQLEGGESPGATEVEI